jgi:hypothetical protein
VALVAVALASIYAVTELSSVDWDATHFVAFGEDAIEIREYAEARLGEVKLRGDLGHDGRFFFVQANDPWVLEPEANALVLDRPLYRTQRMFYPLVAGGFGILDPQGVVWGLLAVNLVAMGLGSWAVAVVASEMGVSPWWGLAFLLNIGLVSELNIDGAGIVAAAAGFGAVALFLKGRFWWGVGMLVVAALSREVMLVVAAGSAWWWWHHRGNRRRAVLSLMIPAAAVGVWATYLRMQIGWDGGVSEVEEIGLPFVGFLRALRNYWLDDPTDLIVGLAMLLILVLFAFRALTRRDLVSLAFVGFALVGILLTEQVWRSYFDITRGIAPVITVFVLMVVSSPKPARRIGSGEVLE